MAHSSVLETYYLTLELVNSNFKKKKFHKYPQLLSQQMGKEKNRKKFISSHQLCRKSKQLSPFKRVFSMLKPKPG